jgi:hypothetical protein
MRSKRFVLVVFFIMAMLTLTMVCKSETCFIPRGSYKETCRNIMVKLTCNAQKADAINWVNAEYDLTDACAVDLANMDGVLKNMGTAKPICFLPAGSYQKTCKDIKVELTCEAQKKDMRTWVEAKYNLTTASCSLELINEDGVLKAKKDDCFLIGLSVPFLLIPDPDTILMYGTLYPGVSLNVDIKIKGNIHFTFGYDLNCRKSDTGTPPYPKLTTHTGFLGVAFRTETTEPKSFYVRFPLMLFFRIAEKGSEGNVHRGYALGCTGGLGVGYRFGGPFHFFTTIEFQYRLKSFDDIFDTPYSVKVAFGLAARF